MKEILNRLFVHKKLTRQEAQEVLTKIGQGEYSEAEIAAFISVYIMRSVSVEELSGFRDALLALCNRMDFSDFETIDMCGTGGDSKNTFNISTLASFVVAGAGGKVAKHGNYGVSSISGSSNVLEYLGYQFSNDESQLKRQLEQANICMMHAPLFHPAMKHVAPIRKKLKVKTFFNMLGPMVNPAFPQFQLVGVFSLELARLYNYIYQQTDKKFTILHSTDGYDEISLTGNVKMISNNSEQLLSPKDFGFSKLTEADLYGGETIKDAAEVFMQILEGKGTRAQNSVVTANAGMGIKCLEPSLSIEDAIQKAKISLESRNALTSFKKFIELSQK